MPVRETGPRHDESREDHRVVLKGSCGDTEAGINFSQTPGQESAESRWPEDQWVRLHSNLLEAIVSELLHLEEFLQLLHRDVSGHSFEPGRLCSVERILCRLAAFRLFSTTFSFFSVLVLLLPIL